MFEPVVTIVPFTTFAKSWGAHGLELPHVPPLPTQDPADEHHYDRRSADRTASANYFAFREGLAGELRAGSARPHMHDMLDYADYAGAPSELVAVEWIERFIADVARHRERLRTRAAR